MATRCTIDEPIFLPIFTFLKLSLPSLPPCRALWAGVEALVAFSRGAGPIFSLRMFSTAPHADPHDWEEMMTHMSIVFFWMSLASGRRRFSV